MKKDIVEEMRVFWNSLDIERRQALAGVISLSYTDYICWVIRKSDKCQETHLEV